jgi:hypothetical protein
MQFLKRQVRLFFIINVPHFLRLPVNFKQCDLSRNSEHVHITREDPNWSCQFEVPCVSQTHFNCTLCIRQQRTVAPCQRPSTLLSPKSKGKGKGKNPCTGLDRPLRLQEVQSTGISIQKAHEGGKVVSPTHRPLLLPRKYSWYSFLLQAESTPGPQRGRKHYVNEKFQ